MYWFNRLFSKTSIQLFFIIWIHNTCLDFFVLSPEGLKFFSDQVLTEQTIVTHLWTASFVAMSYSLLEKVLARIKLKHYHYQVGSFIMLLGFGWFKLA